MEKACGGADSAGALKYFTEYYAVHLEDNTAPYPGVTDALAALAAKGRKMAVVSNKGYDAVQVLCAKFFAPHVTLYYGVNERLKKLGYNAAREFNENMLEWLENKRTRDLYFKNEDQF